MKKVYTILDLETGESRTLTPLRKGKLIERDQLLDYMRIYPNTFLAKNENDEHCECIHRNKMAGRDFSPTLENIKGEKFKVLTANIRSHLVLIEI